MRSLRVLFTLSTCIGLLLTSPCFVKHSVAKQDKITSMSKKPEPQSFVSSIDTAIFRSYAPIPFPRGSFELETILFHVQVKFRFSGEPDGVVIRHMAPPRKISRRERKYLAECHDSIRSAVEMWRIHPYGSVGYKGPLDSSRIEVRNRYFHWAWMDHRIRDPKLQRSEWFPVEFIIVFRRYQPAEIVVQYLIHQDRQDYPYEFEEDD